jgi:hypothetical protein
MVKHDLATGIVVCYGVVVQNFQPGLTMGESRYLKCHELLKGLKLFRTCINVPLVDVGILDFFEQRMPVEFSSIAKQRILGC